MNEDRLYFSSAKWNPALRPSGVSILDRVTLNDRDLRPLYDQNEMHFHSGCKGPNFQMGNSFRFTVGQRAIDGIQPQQLSHAKRPREFHHDCLLKILILHPHDFEITL